MSVSRFEALLEQLETDLETIYGRRAPVVWHYDPKRPLEERWRVSYAIPIPKHGSAIAYGHDGETPLRRLAEDAAAAAQLQRERERSKARKP